MSFKLQNLNVIRIVETEAQKQRLIAQGFEDITPKQAPQQTPSAPPKATKATKK
jgi:hypothetical protein